jgi:hypothetical protein
MVPTLTVTPEANRVRYSPFPFSHPASCARHLGRTSEGHNRSPASSIDMNGRGDHSLKSTNVAGVLSPNEDRQGDIVILHGII